MRSHHDLLCQTVPVAGHGGDLVPAYTARPVSGGPYPVVLVAHQQPGWDDSMMEVTRKIATWGATVICPSLHYRDLPGADPGRQAEAAVEAGRPPDDRAIGDLVGALEYARAWGGVTDRSAVIGFCSGGRHALLVSTEVAVDAVISCYGTRLVGHPEDLTDRPPMRVFERLDSQRAPVLSLFGGQDEWVPMSDVEEFGNELDRQSVPNTVLVYPNAGHAFLTPDRPQYSVDAATDGWMKIRKFLEEQLGMEP